MQQYFQRTEITCCHDIIYEKYLVGYVQILEQWDFFFLARILTKPKVSDAQI